MQVAGSFTSFLLEVTAGLVGCTGCALCHAATVPVECGAVARYLPYLVKRGRHIGS